MDNTTILALFLMLLTFIVMFVDIFFIPTAILSISSILAYMSFLTYVYFEVAKSTAIIFFLLFLGLGSGFLYGLIRYRWWRLLSHREVLPDDKYIYDRLTALKGETARTLTELRPSGKVMLKGQRYDAISDAADFIEKGTLVTVLSSSSAQIVVKPLTAPNANP